LFIFLTAPFSIAWGQEKMDTEGPIEGGFRNDTTARLLMIEWNKVTGGFKRSYRTTAQNHNLAVIEVYSFTGKWICNYIVDQKDIFFAFPRQSGIYFIKVGEKIRAFFLSTGDKLEFMLW